MLFFSKKISYFQILFFHFSFLIRFYFIFEIDFYKGGLLFEMRTKDAFLLVCMGTVISECLLFFRLEIKRTQYEKKQFKKNSVLKNKPEKTLRNVKKKTKLKKSNR